MSTTTNKKKKITCRGKVDAEVRLPGSKSLSNRAVLLAALAHGESELRGVLGSDDLAVMARALPALGARVAIEGTNWRVSGTGGAFKGGDAMRPLAIDVHASGTAARFLSAAATLAQGPVRIDGTPRMRQRPIAALVQSLRGLGAQIDIEGFDGCPPLLCHGGGLPGGHTTVDASRSSQYVSALLQIAPYALRPVTLQLVDGVLVSKPYVDVTLDVMRTFGAEAGFVAPDRLRVEAAQGYRGALYDVEPDASTAVNFFAAAAVTGGEVTVQGLCGASAQADMRTLDLFERMGCRVERCANHCGVRGPEGGALRPISANMNAMPDAVMAIAVAALFADGPSRIEEVGNLRIKESDRLFALETELRKLGANVDTGPDWIEIDPSPPLHGTEVDTYDDHRMAMAFTLAGLRVPDVVIRDPGCVSKSFPEFFQTFDAMWQRS